MPLTKRALGATGIDVSCLGLGTVKFGRNQEVKYPGRFALPEDRHISALLDQARAGGINLIDTAPAYGSSEQRIGRLLQSRGDWVISTKVGEEFMNGKSFFDFSAAHTRHSIERSLRNMKTDFLDIVLIHSDGRDEQIIDASDCIETLQKLKQEGLVRAIGMSTKTVAGGLKAVEHLDIVMATFNSTMQDDSIVIARAAAEHKGVMIKKALDSGHACKEADGGASASLQLALRHPGVNTVIIGTINPDHLQANIVTAEEVCAQSQDSEIVSDA